MITTAELAALGPLPVVQLMTPPLSAFKPGEIRIAVTGRTLLHSGCTSFTVWRVETNGQGHEYVRARAYLVNLAAFIGACDATTITAHDPYTAERIAELTQGPTVAAYELVEGTRVAYYEGDRRRFRVVVGHPTIRVGDLGRPVIWARFGVGSGAEYRPTDRVEVEPTA